MRAHIRLACGCVGWSADQPHLIVTYCPDHHRKNEEKQKEMRRRSLERSRSDRVMFTPAQIAANLEALGG